MIIDINEIDRLRTFLAEEEKYLLSRGDNRWAEEKAKTLNRLGEILLQLRRQKQMTGMGGKEIT
jgi:hypothetical protein